jgi:hypothetical protein
LVDRVDAWCFQIRNDLLFSSANPFPQKGFGDSQTHELKPVAALIGMEGLVVLSLMKDSRATISSIDYMITKTSLLPARDSRHERLYHSVAWDGNAKK